MLFFIFSQNARLAVTGNNALVYADAKMEPLAVIPMVLVHAPQDTPADTVKTVIEMFLIITKIESNLNRFKIRRPLQTLFKGYLE